MTDSPMTVIARVGSTPSEPNVQRVATGSMALMRDAKAKLSARLNSSSPSSFARLSPAMHSPMKAVVMMVPAKAKVRIFPSLLKKCDRDSEYLGSAAS